MRRLLLRFGSSVLLTTIVGVGAVHAAGGSIDNTGPWSSNKINVDNRSSYNVNNHNSVNVTNYNNQVAKSGDAVVYGNTWGGNATSGDAKNYNSTSTNVSIGSPSYVGGNWGNGSGDYSISNTGPKSYNKIDVDNNRRVNINNHNSVNVTNYNDQHAYTGDAIVSHNTHGGNATSGDAVNYNSTSTNVNIDGHGSWQGSGDSWKKNDWKDDHKSNIGYVGSSVYRNSYDQDNCCHSGNDAKSHHHNYGQKHHHKYPRKPYDGLGGHNPCVNPCEISHHKHSRLHVQSSYYPRHKVKKHHHKSSVDCYRPKHIQPCHVISHPPIRPPCVKPCHPVVVKPCHPVYVKPCQTVVKPCHVKVSPCKRVIHKSNYKSHHQYSKHSDCQRTNYCHPVHKSYSRCQSNHNCY